MKQSCELCKGLARIYCESDQASLCYDCDAKVHSANFLVARHSRNFLCQGCQSPTPWSASGSKLRPNVCFCNKCVDCGGCDESSEENEEEEADGEEIVPWSPPPPSESSSSDDEEEELTVSRKRGRVD